MITMVYTNQDIARKANTYIRKVSDTAKAHEVGTKINNKILQNEQECLLLLEIVNQQKNFEMSIVRHNLRTFGPIKRGPLAEKCDMHWITFNRILADLTFSDPHICEDDQANLEYIC